MVSNRGEKANRKKVYNTLKTNGKAAFAIIRRKMKNKRVKRTGLTLIGTSIGLFLLLGIVYLLSTREDVLNKRIQQSVLRIDNEMQQLIGKGLNNSELEKEKIGLVVFMNDTLVYWNNNDVHPKLMKRKVKVGNDTICHLLNGNYFIKSYQTGSMTYYLFKLLNTTYPIENRYFQNYSTLYPQFIDVDISFEQEREGRNIHNHEGKTLTRCQINTQPKIKKPYAYLPYLFLILLLAGIIMAFGSKNKNTRKKKRFQY